MPTIAGHAAVALAAAELAPAIGHRAGLAPGELRVLLVFASCAPDLDVIGFHLDIPYLHALGHRGASHALLTALTFGLGTAITL